MNILATTHSTPYRNHSAITKSPPSGSRIAPSSAVVTVTSADQLTLIHLGEGRRIALQSFGSRVWALIAGHPTLALLLEQLRHEGGRPEQIAQDVTHLLADWRRRGMIEWR